MKRQKYILVLCAFILLIPQFCQAQKEVSSEVHDMLDELLMSTMNYDRAILEDDIEKGRIMQEKCWEAARKSSFLLGSIPNKENVDFEAVYKASTILMCRESALKEFCDLKEAENANDDELAGEHREDMYEAWKTAKELRKSFFEEYGF